jgi:hypothetical protein
MSLFNRLKPELVLFRDHVVSFQFTDWGDGFSYAKTRFTYTKLRSRTSSKPQPTTPSTLLDWKSVSATSAPSSRFS